MKVSSCVLGGMLPLLALCGTSCSTSDSAASTASNSGKYYAVSVKEAEFYLYGPQQANGPDWKLPQDTLMTLIRPSFGYSKVMSPVRTFAPRHHSWFRPRRRRPSRQAAMQQAGPQNFASIRDRSRRNHCLTTLPSQRRFPKRKLPPCRS